MSAADAVFSDSYRRAREKFLATTAEAGLPVESRLHPEKGAQGEDLAMDVARDGHPDVDRLLILSSACHGVEGYCGSGVQVAALRDAEWRDRASRGGVAVLYIHALNPYGFSHTRRVTHENVDLNRNFQDFSQPLPVNKAYRELHPLLLPDQWPPTSANESAIAQYLAAHGPTLFQAAISGGQHEFPDGLFFGGTAPTWSNLSLREVLRTHARRAGRIAWIDIHTGLGPSGVGERIFAGRDDAAGVARARSWWGGGVTSIYDGSSSSAFLTGLMCNAIYEECPQAQYTGIALEYGTIPLPEMLQALRAGHWAQLHGEAPPSLKAQIKRKMKDAFYTDTTAWKDQVLQQAREALSQAVEGLVS